MQCQPNNFQRTKLRRWPEHVNDVRPGGKPGLLWKSVTPAGKARHLVAEQDTIYVPLFSNLVLCRYTHFRCHNLHSKDSCNNQL